jgi:hypothetical protein
LENGMLPGSAHTLRAACAALGAAIATAPVIKVPISTGVIRLNIAHAPAAPSCGAQI